MPLRGASCLNYLSCRALVVMLSMHGLVFLTRESTDISFASLKTETDSFPMHGWSSLWSSPAANCSRFQHFDCDINTFEELAILLSYTWCCGCLLGSGKRLNHQMIYLPVCHLSLFNGNYSPNIQVDLQGSIEEPKFFFNEWVVWVKSLGTSECSVCEGYSKRMLCFSRGGTAHSLGLNVWNRRWRACLGRALSCST